MATIGSTRITGDDLRLRFVIVLYNSLIKRADVERLFAPYYAPEAYEVVDYVGKPTTHLPPNEGERRAYEFLAHTFSPRWPNAKTCIALTTCTLSLANSSPACVEVALGLRKHIFGREVLNSVSVQKIGSGHVVPRPNVLREVRPRLVTFVRGMLSPEHQLQRMLGRRTLSLPRS